MSISRRDVLQVAGVASLLSAVGQQAWAQTQLESLKIVTGFPPGGTSDAICRRVSEKIAPSAYTKAAFVENKTGAGGQIAVQFVRNAPADGATVLQTPMSMLGIYPHIYKKLPYDPVGDLAPVSLGAVFDFGFAVGPMVPNSVRKRSRVFGLVQSQSHVGQLWFTRCGLYSSLYWIPAWPRGQR